MFANGIKEKIKTENINKNDTVLIELHDAFIKEGKAVPCTYTGIFFGLSHPYAEIIVTIKEGLIKVTDPMYIRNVTKIADSSDHRNP